MSMHPHVQNSNVNRVFSLHPEALLEYRPTAPCSLLPAPTATFYQACSAQWMPLVLPSYTHVCCHPITRQAAWSVVVRVIAVGKTFVVVVIAVATISEHFLQLWGRFSLLVMSGRMILGRRFRRMLSNDLFPGGKIHERIFINTYSAAQFCAADNEFGYSCDRHLTNICSLLGFPFGISEFLIVYRMNQHILRMKKQPGCGLDNIAQHDPTT